MQVILLERIEKLGQMGDIVKVKPGYARNYLLPRKIAVDATPENVKMMERRRARYEAELVQREADISAKIEAMTSNVLNHLMRLKRTARSLRRLLPRPPSRPSSSR